MFNLDMIVFNDFVDRMNLIDLPILGRRFVWFRLNEITMSRLYIFLVSGDGWIYGVRAITLF
jgi:hypothetical protein